MALNIKAVLQAQRAEFVVGERAGDIALQLVAELRGAGADELAVEIGIPRIFLNSSFIRLPMLITESAFFKTIFSSILCFLSEEE